MYEIKEYINKKIKIASTPGTREELKKALTPSNRDIYNPGAQVKKAISKKGTLTSESIVKNII